MADTIKLRRFGGSLGVVLPKSVTDGLSLHEGDELFVTATPEGLTLTPFDPEFGAALDDAREFMRTHRNAFRELSK
jgi:putative addiction module antidote